MAKILVSAVLCIDVSVKINEFPVIYKPINVNPFAIDSAVSGVCANVAMAFRKLKDSVDVISFLSKDDESYRIRNFLNREGINVSYISDNLKATPHSVILYDESGKRRIESDMKDIYEARIDETVLKNIDMDPYDAVVIGNFSPFLDVIKEARRRNKLTVCDVQVIDTPEGGKNKEFMANADILFFSDEKVQENIEDFIMEIERRYNNKIIVAGRGKKGAAIYIQEENKISYVETKDIRPVINTCGAGDAMCTCFMHYYLKGDEPLEALKKAQIFASYKIGESGASVGFPDEEIVEKYYTKFL